MAAFAVLFLCLIAASSATYDWPYPDDVYVQATSTSKIASSSEVVPSTLASRSHAYLSSIRSSVAHSSAAYSSPVHSSVAHSSPVHSSAAHSSPVHSSAAHSSPVHSSAAHSSPVHSSAAHSSPVHSSAAHSSPVHSSAAHSSPVHSSAAHSSPVHSSAAHSSAAHSSPVHSSTAHSSPVHSSSVMPSHVSTMAVSSKNTTAVPSTSKVIPSSHSAHSSTPAPSSSSMHSLSPSPSSSPSPITSHSASPTPTPHSSPAPTKSVTPAMSSSASPTSHPNASSPSPSASPTSHPNGSSPSPSASPIHPNSTSHVSPTPSSSAAPHSSKAPTLPPTPAPHYTKFDVMDPKTNKSCIMVAGVFKFTVQYQMMSADKKKHPMGTAMFYIAMTNETSVSGSCAKNAKNGDSIAMISVNSNHATFTWSFSVAKDNTWTTSNMTLNVTTNGNKHFTNATEAYIYSFADKKSSNTKPFTASKGHSYLCNTAEVVKLTKEVKLDVSYLRVQPVEGKSDKFNTADTCSAVNTSNKTDSLVPIIVGCSLAGLIVIVLIAYLIGRRRAPRGYQNI